MAQMKVLENKVRKGFRFFDLNKNGYLTRDEMVKVADKISSLSNATEAEAEETRHEWTKWCDMLFPEGEITEDEFVSRHERFLTENPQFSKSEDDLTYGNMFEMLDSNKDGFISPEELRLYYKAFGYGDDHDIDQIFRTLDVNHDGLISREEFIKATVTYWTDEPGYEYLYDIPRK